MLEDFPNNNGAEREQKILDCIKANRYNIEYESIFSTYKNHKAEFFAFADALKIDGIRVNVTATTQQQIADLLRCVLPTAKLYDLIWDSATIKLKPHPRNITSTTIAMIEHSREIDKELSYHDNIPAIRSTVGKTWILDNSLVTKTDKAINYGWPVSTGRNYKGIKCSPSASLPNVYVIQPISSMHNKAHTDYSQICLLISRTCIVDNKEMDILDVFKDPELAPLANHDGILKIIRQPDVPVLNPIVPKFVTQTPISLIPEPLDSDFLIPEIIPIDPIQPQIYIEPKPIVKEKPNNIFASLLNIFKR